MKFRVEIHRTRVVEYPESAVIDLEADGLHEAGELAEAHAKFASGAIDWVPRGDAPSNVKIVAYSAIARGIGAPAVIETEHGLTATCVHCETLQNNVPPRGPWRCQKCEQVNQPEAARQG